jgi:autophagy-related protein 9
LLGIGLWDDQAVFQTEILPNKTALWFTAVGGSIVAVCRGLIPDENAVIEPVKAMEEVVQHTHYFPKSWRGRVHGHKVLNDFTALFQFRLVNFLLDLLSVLLAPFILMFSLPKCAGLLYIIIVLTL